MWDVSGVTVRMTLQTFAGSKNVLTRSKETFAVTADVTRYMLSPIISRRMSKTVIELKTMEALRDSCMAAVYCASVRSGYNNMTAHTLEGTWSQPRAPSL